MSALFHRLAPGVTVIERGWLNCNQVVLTGGGRNTLIDSGYGRHAEETCRLVDRALAGGRLDWLINTHCHSDHMGGNRLLRERYGCRIAIPVGEVKHVVPWTAQSCWSEQMDQYAEEFAFDDTLSAGDRFEAGGLAWEAHAAPGHDMDALMFFAPAERILATGDALWERGLGFVWPRPADAAPDEPDVPMAAAFAALETIESLAPRIVVPGHGAPFDGVTGALGEARGRLNALAKDPVKNARHVAKVMFVFALLDKREMALSAVPAYLAAVPVYAQLREEYFKEPNELLAKKLIDDLVRTGVLYLSDDLLRPTIRI